MARVTLPRTSEARRERGYALLVARVAEDGAAGAAFRGKLFRCGAGIEESELWPSDEWPRTPLVLEYAGRDFTQPLARPASGWGWRERPRLYVLWRYAGEGEWTELARTSAVANEWIERMAAVARLELARSPPRASAVEIARRASNRALEALDRELAELDCEALALALSFLCEELAARVASVDGGAA